MTRQLFVADRRSIEAWRIAVAREREAYEVVRADGGPEWRRVAPEAGERWALDDVPLPLVGPKRFFFPEREVLVRWRGDAADDRAPEPAPFALLGVRPCDLTAIAMLDRFFADDGAYRARRACGLVIGVNCASACSGGFCRDVDAGPFATAGFDVDLTVLSDDRIAVEIATAAGEDSLAAAGVELRPASAHLRCELARARAAAESTCRPHPFVARAIARVEGGIGAPPILRDEWAALSNRCLACTGCTSLCPTCTCFTVCDEGIRERDERGRPVAGARVRSWDSCLLEGFQREASGHHPAPEPGDRLRRFWTHKLARGFDRCDRIACVGCGRCDVTCPGSIGGLRGLAALAGPGPAPRAAGARP